MLIYGKLFPRIEANGNLLQLFVKFLCAKRYENISSGFIIVFFIKRKKIHFWFCMLNELNQLN